MKYKVVEKFVSVNGEGPLGGQLAVFIRFAGCNLNCSYCDTLWANNQNVPFDAMNAFEIYDYIKSTKVRNITLTGGEPLLQEGMLELLQLLSQDKELHVEIETNGSVSLEPFLGIENPPSFTMDYKLPSSDMEGMMQLNNLALLTEKDTLKFVAGSLQDLDTAKKIIDTYNLTGKTRLYISPVFGSIEMEQIVEFMIYNNMNGVNLQIQLHKVIWDPNRRGV